MDKLQVVIITGLSGSGKTNAVDWFEDQNYYCIDNMPPALMDDFISLTSKSQETISKVAFVVDIRGGAFFHQLKDCIKALKNRDDINCKILFIEASYNTLIRRFNETRRNHPLSTGRTDRQVLQREKEELSPIRDMADHIIDTTNLKVAGLKEEIGRLFLEDNKKVRFAVNIQSFGYKHGLPTDSDLVFDVRFIPNPYYVKSLKKLTGKNIKVSKYVLRQPIAQDFLTQLESLLSLVIPGYIKEGKYHLNICFGCTGGQHRSVAMAVELGRRLKDKGYRVTVEHRDH